MSRPTFIFTLAFAALACDPTPATRVPDRLDFVLTDTGIGASMVAPERAHVEAGDGQVSIAAGDHFALSLTRGDLDLQAEQRRVIDDQRARLQEFLRHDQQLLLWRWGPSDAGRWYHFVYRNEIAGISYFCRSDPDTRFTRQAIDAMLRACKSVRFDDEPGLGKQVIDDGLFPTGSTAARDEP